MQIQLLGFPIVKMQKYKTGKVHYINLMELCEKQA